MAAAVGMELEMVDVGAEPTRWAYTAGLAADWLGVIAAADGDAMLSPGSDAARLVELASALRAEVEGGDPVLGDDWTVRRLELTASALRVGFGIAGGHALGGATLPRRIEAARALDEVADVLRARNVRRWSALAIF